MDLQEMQKAVYQNKLNKGFNVTNVEEEFCLLYGEVAEAYEAYRKKKSDLGLELADIGIYLLGLSEILGFDLKTEMLNKIDINAKRVYKNENGTVIKIEGGETK